MSEERLIKAIQRCIAILNEAETHKLKELYPKGFEGLNLNELRRKHTLILSQISGRVQKVLGEIYKLPEDDRDECMKKFHGGELPYLLKKFKIFY